MAVALLGLGLLGCAAETDTGRTTHALTTDASVPIALEQAPEGLAEAASPDWRIRLDAKLVTGCTGSEYCGAGEQCCPLSGECVPADCDDCCVTPEIPNGPMDDPEIDDPDEQMALEHR